MTPFVLDASAGVELALQTPIGRRLQKRLPPGSEMWVPEHYFAEATAVLRRSEINQRYGTAKVQVALDWLLTAPVSRASVRPLISEAWTLRHNMTMADGLYVVVALHLQAPLVTTDLKLANAPKLPVETVTP